jgi:hypothetical protein
VRSGASGAPLVHAAGGCGAHGRPARRCEEGDPGCEQVHQVLRTLGDAGDVLELSSGDDTMLVAESPPFPDIPSEGWDTDSDSGASGAADGAAGG